jgi:signal transduction histidine kinase/ActR/RegA family two-component response regulator
MPWLERIIAREPVLPLRPLLAYPAAALLIGTAYAARLALGPALVGVPFMTFTPAVFMAAVLGGFAPGIFAAVLTLLLFWLAPLKPFAQGVDWEQTGGLAYTLFVSVSLLFCLTLHGFYAAVERLRETRRRERELLVSLERRVAERTRQLTEANEQLRQEIIEREKAETVARQGQKMQLIGQLAGGVAHDFNNLLTVIIGNIEAAQRRLTERDPEVAARITQALRGAERAATLTQRLLAFARQQPLAPTAVDVNRLIATMSDLIRRTLGAQIAIETVLAGGLWRTKCDANQLEAALLNLVVNARDAMPEGGKLTIESANAYLDQDYADRHEEVAPGQYVMIAVTDTGSGMPREVIERAFDPFFTTKAPGHGTGLGLSMVYGFVKQSGGHVKIYSEPGHGTSVKIYLPRLIGGHEEADEARKSAAAAPPEQAMTHCTVLVVEDEPDVREFAVQTLTELGYRVCEASDGPTAIQTLRAEPAIEVLLTDVVLPNTDLRALVGEAERLHPGIRVIYTTGYTSNAIIHGGILDPGVDLLPKPFTASALARKLRATPNPAQAR